MTNKPAVLNAGVPTQNLKSSVSTPSRNSSAVMPVGALVATAGSAAWAFATSASAALTGVIVLPLAVLTFLLYALNHPRVQRLAWSKQAEVTLAAAQKAERVVAEIRELAASLVHLQLESYGGLGRLGGTATDHMRHAAGEVEKRLWAIGCTSEEINHALHPAYRYIRRDDAIQPLQRMHATVAKEKGVNLGNDPSYTDWLDEFGKLYISDPSPEKIEGHLAKLDKMTGKAIMKDPRIENALMVHRALWNERPAPAEH